MRHSEAHLSAMCPAPVGWGCRLSWVEWKVDDGATSDEGAGMTEYLIAFNDEWVPDCTDEEMAERSEAVRALRSEMKAAGVYVF